MKTSKKGTPSGIWHSIIRIWTRYKRLNLWSKIALWGSLASIIGLIVSLVPLSTPKIRPELVVDANQVYTTNRIIIPGWGEVINPDGRCTFSLENGKLKISVPGIDHSLSIERGQTNAPRVLREVEGNFDLQVKVSADFPRGATSVVATRHPYQSAGLLLWQDSSNYVRLERAQLVTDNRTWSLVNLEVRRKGDFEEIGEGSQHHLDAKEVYLRLQRRGGKIFAYLSTNGAHWLGMRPLAMELPTTVRVGVLAVHNTSTPLNVEFEDLRLARVF